MKDITLILWAVFCVIAIVFVAVPRTQAYTLQTTYTVKIDKDGTASWKIEQSAYLENDVDVGNFGDLIHQLDIDQFTSNVSAIIDQAYVRTGRLMTFENITVGGTESGVGAYGYLYYSFDWTNFASVENTDIAIGDGFSNESFIFGDGGLTILLPAGYSVKSCFPSPDSQSNGLLEWDSIRDLQNDQPNITLAPASESPVLIEVMVPLTVAILASALVLTARRKKNESALKTIPAEAHINEMGDKEKILTLLKERGGQMLQSKITEQLKFSKAKTSRILGEMENKGAIKRHKTGRDKVVSLQKETDKPGN